MKKSAFPNSQHSTVTKELVMSVNRRIPGKESAFGVIEVLEPRRLMSAAAPSPIEVYPPGSTVKGLTLGEWSAVAWQWTVSYPLGHNPNNDDPGGPLGAPTDLSRLGNIGGGVFMLAGSAVNGTAGVTRNIEIPTGKPVFIPILTVEWSTAETGHTTFADLLADNKATIADITGMHCILDGQVMSLADIFSHEEISPLYQFNLPDNNVLGVPATTSPTHRWPMGSG
jgi:hypothetical protein